MMRDEEMNGVLSGDSVRALCNAPKPLIEGYADLDAQVQQNGFDLRLAEIHAFQGNGMIAINNSGRILPGLEKLNPDEKEFWTLSPGPYHIVYEETVNLPLELMALGRPRSSLTRSGVAIHTAVWDAGYSGRSTSLMVVSNPAGFVVERGARVMQLVFLSLDTAAATGYDGIYQGENANMQAPNR